MCSATTPGDFMAFDAKAWAVLDAATKAAQANDMPGRSGRSR
jgi:hypothetical protein